MNNLTKHFKISKILPITIILLIIFVFSPLPLAQKASAGAGHPGTPHNVSGYGWALNTGLISFNCANDTNTCATVDYGVDINPTYGETGDFSGQAWSPNLGRISFDRLGIAGTDNPPSPPFETGAGPIAQVNWRTGKVTGWARVLSAKGYTDNQWDGWIKLSDDSISTWRDQGLKIDKKSGKFSGYVWGSEVFGWANMAPTKLTDSISWEKAGKNLKVEIILPDITVTPTPVDQIGVVSSSADTTLTWQTDGDECEVKYSTGSAYSSFRPRKSSTITTNTDREMFGWSAMVPTKKLGPGLYGYQIVCKDSKNTYRADGSNLIKLKLSTEAMAQIFLDSDPNYLIWKCLNSSQSFIDEKEMFGSIQGRIKNNNESHILRCQNLDITKDPVSATYNPSRLSLEDKKDFNSRPIVAVNYSCPTTNFKRAELYKDKTPFRISNTNTGNYSDAGVNNQGTYLYKLYCYNNRNILSAYSQQSIKIGTVITQEASTFQNTSCSYRLSDNTIQCRNIEKCPGTISTYAIQINETMKDGSLEPDISSGGSETSYQYKDTTDKKNTKIYQYVFACPKDNTNININDYRTYTAVKILPAIVPAYSHFLNFNISAMNVQASSTVSLNWNIQNPTSSCYIIPKYINSTSSLNSILRDFKDQQTFEGSDLYRDIKGQGSIATTSNLNSKRNLLIDKSTRFTASCQEAGFGAGNILNGIHYIIKDVYVIKEGER